jgi:hypothetical protein
MKQIELTQGLFALVDDETFDRLNEVNWYAHRERKNIYALRKFQGEILKMHRVIMNAPEGFDVDHINGNGLDNRRCNLRIVTRKQNRRNTNKKANGCTSKYRGVCWDASRGNWMAYINNDSGRKYLGRFADEVEAARAYDNAGRLRDPEHFTPNFKE